MMRLLGFVVIVLIWGEMAPWGLLVGGILLAGWLLVKPAPLFKTHGLRSQSEQLRVTDAGSSFLSAIPLQNAVYCVNCDLITNSPHDACGVCGSHSVVGVSRMWQLTLGASKPTNAARYKVNLAVDVPEIPVNGLSESTKLLGRLAELGGDVKTLHIKVDPVFSSDATLSDAKTDVLKPAWRTATSVWQQVRPQASDYDDLHRTVGPGYVRLGQSRPSLAGSGEQDSRPRSQARQTRKQPREGSDEAFEELSARQKVG